MTGESVPVDTSPVEVRGRAAARWEKLPAAQRVFAGTINGSGGPEVQVVERSQETTSARVVQRVTEAETQRFPPTQRFGPLHINGY